MIFDKFKRSWMQEKADGRLKTFIILGLVGANILTAVIALRTEKTTVLVPPHLSEEVSISRSKASEGYKTSYATFVAVLLGNITPGNVEFVKEQVGAFFDPTAYQLMAESLADQVKAIREDSITVRFEPQKTSYEPETGKAFVYGAFSSTGVTGKPTKFMRTYEMTFETRNGRLWVTTFTPYRDSPRTLEYLKSQAPTVAQVGQ